MAVRAKLDVLAEAAQYDLSCACGGEQGRTLGGDGKWIYPAVLPNGGTLPVLKVLQASGCERNCFYCRERLGGTAEARFSPDELSTVFMEMVRAGAVKGLFLSSAIRNTPSATMDRMLGSLERIRIKRRFYGFIHTKIIPGAEEAQILRAMQLSDRVSVNLEAPTPKHLARIAPGKEFSKQLQRALSFIAKNVGRRDLRCKSHSTQYVVGAAGEGDLEILRSLENAYKDLHLGRGYFSAFQPIPNTPLDHRAPTAAIREHRLYQSDFLFRKYDFTLDDLVFDTSENLSLQTDPKTLWAEHHPEQFPLEINRAERRMLLRVPGIGPVAADRIVSMRCAEKLDLEGLKAATPRWRTAAPYLLFDGRRRASEQLALRF